MTEHRFKGQYGTPLTVREWTSKPHYELLELHLELKGLDWTKVVLSRDQAADLGRLLLHFGGTGRLPDQVPSVDEIDRRLRS